MDRIEDIIDRECFDENDRKFLKNRDCSFVQYEVTERDIDLYGVNLLHDLVLNILEDAINKSFLFFGSTNIGLWECEVINMKRNMLYINEDTSDLFIVLNNLHQTLDNIMEVIDLGYFDILENFEEPDLTNHSNHFDFNEVLVQINQEKNLIKKKNILIQAIADKELMCLNSGANIDTVLFLPEFKEKCDKAIKIIDELIKNTNKTEIINSTPSETNVESIEVKPVESTSKNPEFTTSRQVLALYYMLNELDKATNSIDRAVKARFIHFLTNKSEDNIYKALAAPFKGFDNKSNKKAIIKDLEYIKSHFEALGLKNIVNQINAEMKED